MAPASITHAAISTRSFFFGAEPVGQQSMQGKPSHKAPVEAAAAAALPSAACVKLHEQCACDAGTLQPHDGLRLAPHRQTLVNVPPPAPRSVWHVGMGPRGLACGDNCTAWPKSGVTTNYLCRACARALAGLSCSGAGESHRAPLSRHDDCGGQAAIDTHDPHQPLHKHHTQQTARRLLRNAGV